MVSITVLLLYVHHASAVREIEHKLQAAFLLNFAKFTDWPSSENGTAEFSVCVIGTNHTQQPFHGLRSKSVHGKPIRLSFLQQENDFESCHVLFISHSSSDLVDFIVEKVGNEPVLLISDIKSFSDDGGIIEFVTIGSRLGFIINNTRAGEIGLAINSSLLNLAAEVK